MRLAPVLALALVSAGCPSGGQTPDPARGGGKPVVADAGVDGAEPGAELPPISSPTCGDQPCVMHLGAGTYHLCLAGGAGTCFHYGALCTPDGACMLDPASKTFRHCAEPGEGRCARFGDPCSPQGSCLIDPADGMHRECSAVAAGRCTQYGDLCDPA